MQAQGFSLNFVLRTLFTLRNGDGTVVAMLTTIVDDVRVPPEGGAAVQHILDRFQVGKAESKKFRFCGKEYAQDDEFCVTVTARDNTECIGSVSYDNAKKLDSSCSEAEVAQLRSVIASLGRIARQVRPALSY